MLPRMALFGLKAYLMQWRSSEEIREFQEKRLRYVVDYAYAHSAFYRKRFREHKITPQDVRTLEDLAKLPTVTKTDLRRSFSEIVSEGFSEANCTVESTSGSTGENVKIIHDSHALDYYAPVHIRGHMAVGLRPQHKTAYIRYKPMPRNIISRFGMFRFEHIASDLPLDVIIERLKEVRAFAINCYPNTLYLLAKKISDEDAEFLSPHHIITWSEKLTPNIRKTLEEKFRCPAYDQYGAFEFHSVAFECPEKKMHINADALVMEFVKDGEPVSPGERGDIVVTNLWNRAMPFIRYEIGDIGVPSDESCACGRGLPLMEELEGRIDDFLVTPSGDIILPSVAIPPFFPYEEIDSFQIVQKKKDYIVIKIVRGKNYHQEIDAELLTTFRKLLGKDMQIEIEHVDEIKKTPGGKLRTIINEV